MLEGTDGRGDVDKCQAEGGTNEREARGRFADWPASMRGLN